MLEYKREEEMEKVVKSLQEGPDYMPDWRHRLSTAYLAEIAACKTPRARLQEILFRERDPFVRQCLRYCFNGKCAAVDAFQYALGCQSRNPSTGAASMIRAMLIADRTPAEIAEELGTAVINIVTFAKLFWDVRRFLDNETFLRRICLGEAHGEMGQTEALRERRWLSASFHRGWPGVEQVVFHRTPSSASDLEEASRLLQAKLAARALEFVEDLENTEMAPSEDDLRRFNASRALPGPQTSRDTGSTVSAQTFIQAVHGLVLTKAGMSDDPALKEVLAIHEARATTGSQPQVRRRRRFPGN